MFSVYLEAYGAVDDQWHGYPFQSYPKFMGDEEVLNEPGKGNYVAPLAGQACNRGEAKRVHLKLFDINNLDVGNHSADVKCQAFNQDLGPLGKILEGIAQDASSVISGASALSPLAGVASQSHALSAVGTAIQQMIGDLKADKEVGTLQTLINYPMQPWKREIPQLKWICYKYMKFQKIYPKKFPGGSDDQDLFLVLFRLELVTAGALAMGSSHTGGGELA